ncbi:glycosyltransferase family 4 protein [Motiliproteus sp. SC1-56]|uniref:glycosyltransferase family 4 protein n=1 Tax=Motiliproteus sp. SC1-56 TaxID=2799565 RepID=UPI001A8E5681|nr:glycosyltransferase family 4 protein [Motiliproteus sp. SC1-56]
MRLCIVLPTKPKPSETFLTAHATLLSNDATVVYFEGNVPYVDDAPIFSQSPWSRLMRKIYRVFKRKEWKWEAVWALKTTFSERADVILAEYGPTASRCIEAAKWSGVPLVTHFHGFDASVDSVIEKYREKYSDVFAYSKAIVAVSRKMVDDLIGLGVDKSKIFLNPCGVDFEFFEEINCALNPPCLVSVGRFVEKKAPHLTILAFYFARLEVKDAKLFMLGGGPLDGVCKDLVVSLGLTESVFLMGECDQDLVKEQMAKSRGFVQHSVKAQDGDCEGTPVSILEAQSMGLPVVATRHAGIADVIVDNETGYLSEERDIKSMSKHMVNILREPAEARKLGSRGAKRVRHFYSMDKSIDNLKSILESSA